MRNDENFSNYNISANIPAKSKISRGDGARECLKLGFCDQVIMSTGKIKTAKTK